MYHPSRLSPEAQERTIQKTQTSGAPLPAGAVITRGELESLEVLIKARLSIALFNRSRVRVIELQKQLIMVKTTKAGI